MLKAFRVLSLIEGLSLLILLCIAMPLKYHFQVYSVVPIVGPIHGILFMAYFCMSLSVSHKEEWSVGFWLLVLLASVAPGACFVLDWKLKKDGTKKEEATAETA